MPTKTLDTLASIQFLHSGWCTGILGWSLGPPACSCTQQTPIALFWGLSSHTALVTPCVCWFFLISFYPRMRERRKTHSSSLRFLFQLFAALSFQCRSVLPTRQLDRSLPLEAESLPIKILVLFLNIQTLPLGGKKICLSHYPLKGRKERKGKTIGFTLLH